MAPLSSLEAFEGVGEDFALGFPARRGTKGACLDSVTLNANHPVSSKLRFPFPLRKGPGVGSLAAPGVGSTNDLWVGLLDLH
jgi:hypothetical protein